MSAILCMSSVHVRETIINLPGSCGVQAVQIHMPERASASEDGMAAHNPFEQWSARDAPGLASTWQVSRPSEPRSGCTLELHTLLLQLAGKCELIEAAIARCLRSPVSIFVSNHGV